MSFDLFDILTCINIKFICMKTTQLQLIMMMENLFAQENVRFMRLGKMMRWAYVFNGQIHY